MFPEISDERHRGPQPVVRLDPEDAGVRSGGTDFLGCGPQAPLLR